MGALEAAFGHFFPLTGPTSWDYGFQLISVLCLGRLLVLSSPYRLHAGLIHLSMDLLYWSAPGFLFDCVFRGLDLRFILCFSHCCHHYSYPDFSIYTPSNLTFLFLCSLSFPLYCSFPHGLSCTYDFDPLLLLSSIPLFLAFHCFCLLL